MIAHADTLEHLTVGATGCLAVGVYALAWFRRGGGHVGRLLAWAGAVSIVLVATSTPVERSAAGSFTGHMVQHLLLITAAPPLFVVSRPVHVLRSLLRSGGTTQVERRALERVRIVGPIAAPSLFLVCLFVTHLTGVYDLALRNRWVHDLEHVAYLGSAVALWAVVLGAGRARAGLRVGSAFAVIGGSAVLGIVLTSATRPLIATYANRLGAADALADQRLAASLMWVGGMTLSLPLLMVAVWTWATREERVARRVESLHDSACVPERPPAI